MKTSLKGLTLALATSLIGNAATAATTPATTTAAAAPSTSTTSVQTTAPSRLSNISLTMGNTVAGPALNSIEKGASFIENAVVGMYKLNDNWKAGAVARMSWDNPGISNNGVTLLDPYLRLQRANIVKAGTFTLNGDYRAYVGVSDASRASDKVSALRIRKLMNFDVPNTKVSIGALAFTTYNVYTPGALGVAQQNADAAHKAALNAHTKGIATNKIKAGTKAPVASAASISEADFYVGPSVEYAILPSLRVGVLYELYTKVQKSNSGRSFAHQASNLEPGISWDVTDKINLNPWIDIPVLSSPTMSNTTLGGALTVKML